MDVVHDQLDTGKTQRVLTIDDAFSWFSPAVDARVSYRGEGVVATLERVSAGLGFPKSIRVDQGSEFVSRDLDLRFCRHGAIQDVSPVGKPTDNALCSGAAIAPPGCSLIAPHIQRPVPGEVREPALVPDACRCPRKAGGLGSIIQRGASPWGHRVQGPDPPHEPRRRSRPGSQSTEPGTPAGGDPELGSGAEARKLQPWAIQGSGSDQEEQPNQKKPGHSLGPGHAVDRARTWLDPSKGTLEPSQK